ncbi:hypothetical protein BEN47_17390 [Hymenobacter lapidarius]|uniref:Uncharacterized protein n=1 Tax=Hymenobacter lapidarius TaxID=1908237 RepID=A0A1G1SYA6_9BACT|nr:hypothetical protein BEN47_17390 [Hymenobacter lapidarius]
MRYALLVLLSISLLFLGLLWMLYHGSSHTIPVETDRFFVVAALGNMGLIWLVRAWIRRGKRAERQQEQELS